MKRRRSFLALCLLPLPFCLLSCGYVGDPLPPALNIPRKISDLRVTQRADRIIVEFTIPPRTTESLPLKLKAVELQAGTWGGTPFDTERWAAGARIVEAACPKPGPCRAEVPAGEWVGQEAFFRVRAVSSNGRAGDWSDFGILLVAPPLKPPLSVRAEAVREGVKITWQAPQAREGVVYRIRRRMEKEETPRAVANTLENQWIDQACAYGTACEYSIQAVLKSGPGEAESEWSEPVTIAPQDRFPPSPPTGLTILAGPGTAELAWDRNTEPDFRGYRVYRATNGGFERIAELIDIPSYSDTGLESGRKYRYAVSAVDQLGNESDRSSPVEIAVP